MHPPSKGKPPKVFTARGCEPAWTRNVTYICQHDPGEIMFMPHNWWHETCGLDEYSVGIGALVSRHEMANDRPCQFDEYTLADLEYCKVNECLTLQHATQRGRIVTA